VLDEARDQLPDAVEDGQRRGWSIEDAQREALERSGAPDLIAAELAPGRHQMLHRVAVVLDRMWSRKWWILAPTAATAIVTSVLSFYFLPTRYRSETVIHILSPRVQDSVLASAMIPTDRSRARVEFISQSILSPSRLEWIIRDFGLYGARSGRPSADQVQMMQRAIAVNFEPTPRPADAVLAGLRVSFQSADPQLAMRITERLAALFVQENLRDREMLVEGESQFFDAELADVRRRLVELEAGLERLRTGNPRQPLSQADLIPYEVVRERYRQLLVRREETRSVANLERRQLGEQFKIVEGARVPERPIGPSRLAVNVMGTLAGLGLGFVIVGVRGRSSGRG
jgi:uncharacterized protein involved in exopolysaccharide biosynthesis